MSASVRHGVPITTAVRRSDALGGYAVKAAVQVRNAERAREVYGFSYARRTEDLARAAEVAQFEALERVFSLPWLYRDQLDAAVTVATWPEGACADRARLRDLCLVPGQDSTGLAIHTAPHLGRAHAAKELLERHLLGEAWYRRSRRFSERRRCRRERSGFTFRLYTLSEPVALPLALVVVQQPTTGLALCGTAFAEDERTAADKADLEALMLLDGHLSGDRGPSNSPRSAQRADELAHTGAAVFAQGLADAGVDDRPLESTPRSLQALAAEVLPDPIQLLQVEVRPGLSLYRARCTSARTLPQWRGAPPAHIPADPFC